MTIVGETSSSAVALTTSDGDATTSPTYRIDLGPGESRDIIFTATTPASADHDVYPFYDREILFRMKDPSASDPLDGFGAMRTEVHIYSAANARPPQDHPNQLFPPA